MSAKQLLFGFHHQLVRLRASHLIRRPVAHLTTPSYPLLRNAALRQNRILQNNPLKTAAPSLFPRSVPDFIRVLLSLTPAFFQHAHIVGVYARRFATLIPGRTVAPLLGLIAAFLQESKTDEFKANVACVAVRDEVNEFKKKLDRKIPEHDFSSIRGVGDLKFVEFLGKGCNAAVYEARIKEAVEAAQMAVKVMFNYVHSDAEVVSRIFENEVLASRLTHPNIVDVFGYFVDQMPLPVDLPECRAQFFDALPERSNPQGFGRDQTMFLLMKKYSCTLRSDIPYGVEDGLFVFAQLLEAVVKCVKENVVHRDIKSDNILLAKSEDGKVLRAVISDFGCCLRSLRLHYTTSLISRGGNTALMAPEVYNAQAGLFSVIDYSRADLWSVGTIAYEIFAGYNPFFEGENILQSSSYDESDLPTVVPGNQPLDNLVHAILRRDPAKRPSPAVAATACHLLLWDFPLHKAVPTVENCPIVDHGTVC